MTEIVLNEDVAKQAEKALDLLENLATKAGIPSRALYLGEQQKRRIVTAIKNLYPRISEQVPCIGRLYLPACLAIASCSHSITPDTLTAGSAGVAAAMWMREQIDKSVLSEAKISEIFSSEHFKTLPIYTPEVCDNDLELLASYTKAVTNRLSPLHYQYENSESEQRYGTSHDEYTKLKAAVPQTAVQEAENVFKDRLMAYLETELKIVKLFLLKYQNSKEELIRCETAGSILFVPKKCDFSSVLNTEPEPKNDPMVFLNSAMFSVIALPLFISGYLPSMKSLDWETLKKIRKIVNGFDPLHTSDGRDVDPFTIAFGYQHLLDQDDDFAYLPGISCAMVGLYVDMLPWAREERDCVDRQSELPVWCRESYSVYAPKIWIPTGNKKKTGIFENPAQILYEKIYKENTDGDANLSDTMEKNTSAEVATGVCDNQSNATDAILRESSKAEDTRKIIKERDALDSENKYLRKELTVLRKNLNRSEWERTSTEKQVNELRAQTDIYLGELRELRQLSKQTIIPSLISNSEGEAEQKGCEYQYPCPIEKKIVIYGGQDAWKSAIDKLIPGVKFAKDSKHVDTDLIKHADVIWVQTHAISHAVYTTVRDCAKKNGIPIRIFTTKGIASCAAQLASCAVG